MFSKAKPVPVFEGVMPVPAKGSMRVVPVNLALVTCVDMRFVRPFAVFLDVMPGFGRKIGAVMRVNTPDMEIEFLAADIDDFSRRPAKTLRDCGG